MTSGPDVPPVGEDWVKRRYRMVCEDETPLPRQWSIKDKCTHLGLSQSNLRVHYKGNGKNHKDAASIRSTHSIPASCGIYYYEVKVISKGREGYMGIGLSSATVNLNRLPGWEKNSYGYHGDDGHSFCSSGTGQPYGPTFTTGDVIGCCINLVDNTCFYTKNGINLGVAFRNLPSNLYPTVGLQTPGEVIEANFGQSPFLFDIDDYVQEWRLKTRTSIEHFAITNKNGEWQTALQKIVSSYLIHNGYCATAEAFAQCTGQSLDEELVSIRNRQNIQRLVLSGRIGEAITATQQLYPTLFERNSNLLFSLKIRQFIEMVNGTDDDAVSSSTVFHVTDGACRDVSNGGREHSPGRSLDTEIGTSTQIFGSSQNGSDSVRLGRGIRSKSQSPSVVIAATNVINVTDDRSIITEDPLILTEDPCLTDGVSNNANNGILNGSSVSSSSSSTTATIQVHNPAGGASLLNLLLPKTTVVESLSDNEMDTSEETEEKVNTNGTTCFTNGTTLSTHHTRSDYEAEMDVDHRPFTCRPLCTTGEANLVKILQFGRELHAMAEQLKRDNGRNETNKKVLKDAFSLLAYADPWNSSVGHQLHPVQREPICTSLNSAILELQGLPKQPPLELAIAHTTQCVKLMSKAGIGSCAFANVNDYLQ